MQAADAVALAASNATPPVPSAAPPAAVCEDKGGVGKSSMTTAELAARAASALSQVLDAEERKQGIGQEGGRGGARSQIASTAGPPKTLPLPARRPSDPGGQAATEGERRPQLAGAQMGDGLRSQRWEGD